MIVNEYEMKKQKDTVERCEAQNELLSRQNSDLRSTIERIMAENRTKAVLRQEIETLKKDRTILEDKCQTYCDQLAEMGEKFDRLKNMRTSDMRKIEDYEHRKESENSDLAQKISDLESEMMVLRNEKLSMMEDFEKAKRTISAYQSDKRNFATALDRADTHKRELEETIERHEAVVDRIKAEVLSKDEDTTRLETRINELKRDKTQRDEAIQSLHSEIDRLKAEVIKERRSKAEVELLAARLEGNVDEEKGKVIRLETRKTFLEDQVKSLNEAVNFIKDEKEGKDIHSQKLDSVVSSLRKEVEFVRRDNKVMQELIDEAKRKQEISDVEKHKLVSELRRTEEKVNLLRRELEVSQESTRKREDELLNLQREKGKLSTEVGNLSAKEQALDVAKKQMENLNEKLITGDKEKLSLKTDIEVLRVQIDNLHDNLRQLEAEKSRVESLKKEFEKELNDSKEHNFSNTLKIKQLEEKNRLGEKIKGDYSQSSSKVHSLEGELKRLSDEKRNALEECYFLKKVVGEKDRAISTQSEEIARLQEGISIEKDGSRKNVSLAAGLNEQIKRMELVIEELKSKIKHQQEFISNYEKEIDLEKLSRSHLEGRLKDNLHKVSQLQAMIQNLESSKEELISKIKHEYSRGLDGESSFQKVAEELRTTKQQLMEISEKLTNTNEAITMVEQERDDMQFLLDDKTEQLEAIKMKYKDVTEELYELKNSTGDRQGQTQQFIYRIEKRNDYLTLVEEDINKLTCRNQDISDINESIKSQLTTKDRECASMMSDLNVVSRQNKNLTVELQKYSELSQDLKMYV